MNLLRAAHLGFCFGVRDAIGLALDTPGPVTILGDLVHNESVLDDLRSHGVRFAEVPDDIATPTVMITAHGASEKCLQGLRERGLKVMEATCPLVRRVRRVAAALAREGYHPVVVGKAAHAEVRGVTEDLDRFDVIQTEEDVRQLQERARFGVIAQTTQPIEKALELVLAMRKRFPTSEVRFIDTICQPTKLRQAAAIEIALQAEVVVVIGGAGSNNTRELVATCARFCSRVHHVQSEHDLVAAWFEGVETVGVTAGTSTPDETVLAVEQRILELSSGSAAAAPSSQSTKEDHEPFLAAHAF